MRSKFALAAGVAALAGLFSATAHAATPAAQAGNSNAIMLQGFHWNSAGYTNANWYNRIRVQASDIKNLGITHVWFPPPSNSIAREGYLPRQLNDLNSSYGSATDLKNAVSAFTSIGVRAVADIVVNHRVGSTNACDFTNPNWSTYTIVNGDEAGCGRGNWDSGDGYGAARDIDHQNVGEAQNGIKAWLNNVIKPAGFSGIRFDYSKGYGATYAGMYSNHFLSNFCVGEVWTDLNYNDINSHRQQLMNFVNGTNNSCGVFDFTTKGLLNDALWNNNYWRLRASDGKPQGAIGWWPAMSVTFVDNHDTGPSESCGVGQNHWPVPSDKVMQGYAYILSHPGVPTIYYPHVYNWGLKSGIQALINARRGAGVTSTSSVSIQRAENGLYAAIVQGNTRKLAMKIGPNSWSPGAGWTLLTSGNNYAVWQQ